MAKKSAKKSATKKTEGKPAHTRNLPSPNPPGESKPLSVTTQEFVRLLASQTRSHKATAAALIAVVIAVGLGAYWWVSGHSAPPPSVEVATPPPGPERVTAAPPTDNEAKEALRKAPKPIAALLNGPRRPAPAPASAAPPPPGGDLRVPRLNAYDLARAIAADRRGAVQLCYEHELKRNPRLRGRVTVDLQLKSPHQVGEVRVIDNLKRASFTGCVQKAMRHVDFPPLGEDLSVEIPFALTSPDL